MKWLLAACAWLYASSMWAGPPRQDLQPLLNHLGVASNPDTFPIAHFALSQSGHTMALHFREGASSTDRDLHQKIVLVDLTLKPMKITRIEEVDLRKGQSITDVEFMSHEWVRLEVSHAPNTPIFPGMESARISNYRYLDLRGGRFHTLEGVLKTEGMITNMRALSPHLYAIQVRYYAGMEGLTTHTELHTYDPAKWESKPLGNIDLEIPTPANVWSTLARYADSNHSPISLEEGISIKSEYQSEGYYTPYTISISRAYGVSIRRGTTLPSNVAHIYGLGHVVQEASSHPNHVSILGVDDPTLAQSWALPRELAGSRYLTRVHGGFIASQRMLNDPDIDTIYFLDDHGSVQTLNAPYGTYRASALSPRAVHWLTMDREGDVELTQVHFHEDWNWPLGNGRCSQTFDK